MLRGVARSGCDASFCCCRFSQGVAPRRSGMLRSMSAMLCGAAGKSVSLYLFHRARRSAVGHIKDLIGQTAPATMAGIRIKQGILRMATILRRIFCGARLRCAWRRGAVAGGVRPEGGLARYTGCVYRCVAGGHALGRRLSPAYRSRLSMRCRGHALGRRLSPVDRLRLSMRCGGHAFGGLARHTGSVHRSVAGEACARIAEGAALSARRRFSKSLSFPKVFRGVFSKTVNGCMIWVLTDTVNGGAP